MKKILAVALTLALASGFAYADKTKVRWYVGLGSGGDAPTVLVEKKVVDEFNKSQNDIELVLDVVANAAAYNTLTTQIAGGNAPDVVGPVGIRGRDSFKGAWADLEPLVKKYKYDLSQYDKAMVDFYRTEGQGLVGLPYAIYPSFLYVNRALFKEAGIPLPPQKFGQPYVDENGKSMPWDMNALRMVAMKLTVDASGKTPNDAGFDPAKIVQFGFGQQYGDFRGTSTLFGAGSLVAKDGKTAQIPANWVAYQKWMYDAMWKDYFYPNFAYANSDLLNKTDLFASQHIGMALVHLWYAGFADIKKMDWDLAVTPSYNGKTTAKMHADTFEITRYSKNQDASFKVIAYLMANQDLLKAYGGMPAKKAEQATFLTSFAQSKFPDNKVNWQVVTDSVAYPDNPNHESWMPSFQETSDRYTQTFNKLASEKGLNVDTELAKLKTDLDKIFKAAK
jgi:multiple sugar transport system substrate-binding protein